MNYKSRHKLIITGLPRSGTTFMAATLTELKLGTGYTQKKARQVMEANYGALEYLRDFRRGIVKDLDNGEDNTPKIIKHPSDEEANLILPLARERGWIVDHVLISFRELDPLIKSSIERWANSRKITSEERLQKEKNKLNKLYPFTFGKIVMDILTYEYPHTFIEFPRLVKDESYCYECMKPFLKGISYQRFSQVYSKFADPNKVHF